VVLKLHSLGCLVKDSKLEVVVSKDAVEAFKSTSTERAVYVSVYGRENKGKSFVLSLISNELLPSGLSQHTEGISLRYIKPVDMNKCPPLLLIDTAGASAPYKSAHKLDRLATDCFIRELALKTAHLTGVLRGFLDIEGQRSVDELAQKRDHETAKGGASTLGEIVVVHNFMGLTTVEEVEKQIQRDIIDAFGATHESGWYKSSVSGFSHYVLAQEGSEAGNRYNQRTIELLRSKALHLAAQEVHKVFSKIEDISSQLFPVYLMSDQTSAPTVNIFAKIQEAQGKLSWSFTGRELRMPDDAPRLVTDFACLLGNTEVGMTLVAQTKVQVSPFLHVDRGFPTFENTLEPKMDVCVTSKDIKVTLDANGCEIKYELQGTRLTVKGSRRVPRDNMVFSDRPQGNFEFVLNFPSHWDLSPIRESFSGEYCLTLARDRDRRFEPERMVAKVALGTHGNNGSPQFLEIREQVACAEPKQTHKVFVNYPPEWKWKTRREGGRIKPKKSPR